MLEGLVDKYYSMSLLVMGFNYLIIMIITSLVILIKAIIYLYHNEDYPELSYLESFHPTFKNYFLLPFIYFS